MSAQHLKKKRMISKKGCPDTCGQAAATKRRRGKRGLSLVSLDESFFFYDSLARGVWVDKEKRPVVRATGSHKHLCLFGAMDIEGKQLFRQYIGSTVIRSWESPKDNPFQVFKMPSVYGQGIATPQVREGNQVF